jgi:hypothetical protein
MEIDVIGLRAANNRCRKEKTLKSAEDVCIESLACVMAFIDDCTWVRQIDESEKESVQTALDQAKLVLGFVEARTEPERKTLDKLKESLSKRSKQVAEFKISIQTPRPSKPAEPQIVAHPANVLGRVRATKTLSKAKASTAKSRQ